MNLEDGLKTRVEEKNKVLESVGAKLEKLEAIGGSLTQHTGKFTLTLPSILLSLHLTYPAYW